MHGYVGAGTAETVKRVGEVASKRGVSMAQIGIAWVLSRSAVTAPIVGTTSLKNFEDILG